MALTAQAQAEISAWLDEYTRTLENLKAAAAAAAESAWLSFDGWYDPVLVGALAAETAGLSTAAQESATGAAAQYVETILGIVTGAPIILPAPQAPTVRNGAPLPLVHTRPAEAFKQAIATGKEPQAALEVARQRATGIMLTDVSLATREVERRRLEDAKITRYRRVIRPELSESGSCGLCVVASDRVYKIRELLPIHPPHCKCTTMPITEDEDPGLRINRDDLEAIYAAAGDSTAGRDLKEVRVKVNEHGELGTVLSRKADSFRDRSKVALEDDPDRARRMLDQTRPVLARLEERAAAGEDVSGPLAYQRGLVERLERIAA